MVILVAAAVMCVGSLGGGLYFVWQAARNAAQRQAEMTQEAKRAAAEARTVRAFQESLGGLARRLAARKSFPRDIHDEQGRPLLSWRVALLKDGDPEEAQLYAKFRIDEPWDGPNNRALISNMPQIYAPTRDGQADRGLTYYRGFSQEGAAFGPPAVLTADPAEVLTVFEAGDPIEWSRPDELRWTAGQPRPHFGGLYPGRQSFLAAAADGRVHAIPHMIPDETLRLLFECRKEKRPGIRLSLP
jgi:hypothetical protein